MRSQPQLGYYAAARRTDSKLRIVIDPEQVVFDRGRKRIRILTQM
jgi:hypothetical protein